MNKEEAIRMLIRLKDGINFEVTDSQKKMDALNMAIKSLETIQRIDDVLNVEGMTEIDVLDEIMEAVSEFKYDCGVSE